jgi:type II secretion system protein I
MARTAAQTTMPILKAGTWMSKNNENKRAEMKGTHKSAFTFIEVLIALVIVSISLLALIRMHLISINMTEDAEIKSQAVLLANEKIAETLALGYTEEGNKSGTKEMNALNLHWQTQVTDITPYRLNELDIEGLRRIWVDVSWEQGIGYKHIQMSTYVADRKLP